MTNIKHSYPGQYGHIPHRDGAFTFPLQDPSPSDEVVNEALIVGGIAALCIAVAVGVIAWQTIVFVANWAAK